jgi:Tol biopolymer transport system component/DNA-binding winged helix-turn-helix (wHTH) protein
MEDRRLSSPIRFGIFEVDLQAGELRRQGLRVKLQDQPFQVLVMLLEHPGEVVTREELQKTLWPADTYVDFEGGLNRAINKLREALGDGADSPRFIETLPRRGYRFLAPVETAGAGEVETAEGNRLVLVTPDLVVESSVSAVTAAGRQVRYWGAAAILAVVAAIAFWGPWRVPRSTEDRPFLQMDVDVGPDEFSHPAISPDGTRIVVVSNGALALRRFDQASATRLAGTEGAVLPFFSPNGRWVGFFAARKLQKVAVEGGAPIVLCDAPLSGGGNWSDDDSIVAALGGGGLSRIPAIGGVPQPLTDPKSNPGGKWPQVLPGGKSVLFALTNGSGQGELRILTLSDGKVKTIVENATDGRYLASGYLVYYQQGTLFARPMDASRIVFTGPPTPLVHGVANTGNWRRAEFDLSNSGTLVYRGGGNNFVLSWLDSAGKAEPLRAKPGRYSEPRLSPDGGRLALAVIQDGKPDLWVYDLSQETWNRLTSDGNRVMMPTWTRDGEYLAFRSGNHLAWIRSDGSSKVDYLAGVSPNAGPSSFSTDGKWLAFWPLQDNSDLWIVPVERTPGSLRLGQPQPLLQQAGSKGAPAISPDGRWVAYTSSESGRFEIYVMPLSPQGRAVGRKVPVSDGGGTGPMWSRNGELFYQSLDRRIQVAAYTVRGDKFVAEKARQWSETRLVDMGFYRSFDVAADGKRVLALLPAEEPRAATLVRVVFNVDAELHRRARHGR